MSLDRALGIAKQSNQPLRIVQEKVRPLIRGEAAREAHGEHIFIKNTLKSCQGTYSDAS